MQDDPLEQVMTAEGCMACDHGKIFADPAMRPTISRIFAKMPCQKVSLTFKSSTERGILSGTRVFRTKVGEIRLR